MLNCTNSKSKLIQKVFKLFHKVQKEGFHPHMKKILAGYQNQGRKREEEMKKKGVRRRERGRTRGAGGRDRGRRRDSKLWARSDEQRYKTFNKIHANWINMSKRSYIKPGIEASHADLAPGRQKQKN